MPIWFYMCTIHLCLSCIYLHAAIDVYIYICIDGCLNICSHTCIYRYTRTHTHIHIYIHTYLHSPKKMSWHKHVQWHLVLLEALPALASQGMKFSSFTLFKSPSVRYPQIIQVIRPWLRTLYSTLVWGVPHFKKAPQYENYDNHYCIL